MSWGAGMSSVGQESISSAHDFILFISFLILVSFSCSPHLASSRGNRCQMNAGMLHCINAANTQKASHLQGYSVCACLRAPPTPSPSPPLPSPKVLTGLSPHLLAVCPEADILRHCTHSKQLLIGQRVPIVSHYPDMEMI